MSKKSVLVIGAGEIGSAIANILEKKGLNVSVWDKNPGKVKILKPLEEMIPISHLVFLCTPSWALKEVLMTIKPHLASDSVVISLSKGINQELKLTSDQMLEQFLPKGHKFVVLGGAMLAEEISAGLMGSGVAASKNEEASRCVRDLFAGTNLFLDHSSDIRGVALSGVLKNAYAVMLGMADGFKWSANGKGWIVARAIREMRNAIKELGGNEETVFSMAGIGDLIATGYSAYSLNHQAGEELAKTNKIIKSEGIVSLPYVLELLGEKRHKFRLLLALEEVVVKNNNAREVFEKLFYAN